MYGRSVHSPSGRHEKVLETWSALQKGGRNPCPSVALALARATLDEASAPYQNGADGFGSCLRTGAKPGHVILRFEPCEDRDAILRGHLFLESEKLPFGVESDTHSYSVVP